MKVVFRSFAVVLVALTATACDDPPSSLAHSGAKQAMTTEQFEHIKSDCSLEDARQGRASNGQPAIELTRVRDSEDMANMIVCVNRQLAALNADATVQLADGQMEAM